MPGAAATAVDVSTVRRGPGSSTQANQNAGTTQSIANRMRALSAASGPNSCDVQARAIAGVTSHRSHRLPNSRTLDSRTLRRKLPETAVSDEHDESHGAHRHPNAALSSAGSSSVGV